MVAKAVFATETKKMQNRRIWKWQFVIVIKFFVSLEIRKPRKIN